MPVGRDGVAEAVAFRPRSVVPLHDRRDGRVVHVEVDVSARLLEDAIAAEAFASEVDLEANDAFESAARATFDESYEDLRTEPKPEMRLSIGPDLRVVSVGTATREDARSVRVPLVLGDAEGATASLSLTISLDALLDDGGE